MSTIESEREDQNRVVALLQNKNYLGYSYLGHWGDRENSNFEKELFCAYLSRKGHSPEIVDKVLNELDRAVNDKSKSLYDANKAMYSKLRYGVNIQPKIGENRTTIQVIDWDHPLDNDFSFAEEVTVKGAHTKRPDIVIYVNGMALAVLELKRSSVSLSEGIRQNLDNQKDLFIGSFFTTVQLIMAGNNYEGIAYGAVETKEKYYLSWKEISEENNKDDHHLLKITDKIRVKSKKQSYFLDQQLVQLLDKERFLEIIHDFIVYDRGQKKLCRPNQYFGVKAAQDYLRRREGGIIWHTQGSGKSLTMVWLTKWIGENIDNARVLIITDREELDDQIEKVYTGVSEEIYRTTSGKDLVEKLNDNSPWLLCSLIHKFGGKEEGDVDEYLYELKNSLPSDFRAKGNIFVFVDECHRTQSGKLHDAMKALLPESLFIGFTGTPLLKADKKKSVEIFGRYIHTYKFHEAVKDKVVLDLRYEARDVEQKLGSKKNIDEWFESKTQGLTKHARNELMQKWGTIRKVFSSKERLNKIVMDIMLDMAKKERLQNGHGNALLVSDSIYNACRYYELFQEAGLKECAIITSFVPNIADIKGEETGEGYTEKIKRYDIYKKMLAGYFHEDPEEALKKIDLFEDEVKDKFIKEPARMKLLIVVNKLLTGFDAPSATYLYIDRNLQDHGLFQAVCRVNRLDGDDKDYGYIVDYMDLFSSLKDAFEDYTTGALKGYDADEVAGLLKNRFKEGRERLQAAREAVHALCEPVPPPKNQDAYIHYFCGDDTQNSELIKKTEPRRASLYKLITALVRAYANIADDMDKAGYTQKEIEIIKKEIADYEEIRKAVMIASSDYIDLKKYEPAMRHLIDSYIGAKESRLLSSLEDLSLVELLAKKGVEALRDLPESLQKSNEAMAETIENNMRKVIISERQTNPEYYDRMSKLLDEIIKLRKQETKEYKKYLEKIVELSKKMGNPESETAYPSSIKTSAQRSLYDNVGKNADLAVNLDNKIQSARKDGWKANRIKTREVYNAIEEVLKSFKIEEPDAQYVLDLVKNQREYE